MERCLAARPAAGATRRLPVDGDHIAPDDIGLGSGERGDPGDEATLERLRVEGGQDVAEVIVGRCAVHERTEAPQKRQLLLAEPRHVCDGLGAGQHREQTEQQDLVKGIDHLGALARVRQLLEKLQENNRFLKRTAARTRVDHRRVLLRIRGSRPIQHFRPMSPPNSPDRPAPLRSWRCPRRTASATKVLRSVGRRRERR